MNIKINLIRPSTMFRFLMFCTFRSQNIPNHRRRCPSTTWIFLQFSGDKSQMFHRILQPWVGIKGKEWTLPLLIYVFYSFRIDTPLSSNRRKSSSLEFPYQFAGNEVGSMRRGSILHLFIVFNFFQSFCSERWIPLEVSGFGFYVSGEVISSLVFSLGWILIAVHVRKD